MRKNLLSDRRVVGMVEKRMKQWESIVTKNRDRHEQLCEVISDA